jgi:hypothetical protein
MIRLKNVRYWCFNWHNGAKFWDNGEYAFLVAVRMHLQGPAEIQLIWFIICAFMSVYIGKGSADIEFGTVLKRRIAGNVINRSGL